MTLVRRYQVSNAIPLLCDSGCYTGGLFAKGVREILGKFIVVQIVKRSKLHTFKIVPKRWIVGREFPLTGKGLR